MKRHVLLACLVTALAASSAMPREARADDAAVAEAQQRFQEGLALADESKHEPARLKFQQAWAVFKAPAVLYNLARSEQLTGHELEALEHFRLFVKLSATDAKITDAMRDKARSNVEELSKKVGQIELEVPSTARVTVDGKPIEAPPPGSGPRDPVPVAPGRHTVEALFEGKLKSVSVECQAGALVRAKIEFEAGAGAGSGEPPGGGEPTSPARWIVPAALGVAGLAGLGLGIGMAASSQSAKDDSEALRRANPRICGQPTALCSQYDDKRSDAESAATISYVGYIAGGALLAGAVATYFLWPRSAERGAGGGGNGATSRVTPLVGAGVMGAGFEGRF